MKLGLRKDIDWQYVGAMLARADDNEQAECLKAFVAECKTWGTSYQVEGQLASVNLKLTKEERETLEILSYNEEETK
jgi:hypothetical protein